MGNILANLHELYETISPEYKQDLNTYCLLLQVKVPDKRKVPLRAWGLFVKMMWALKRMYSEIDLCEINREDILKNEYPISTVGEAMDIGILFHIEEANILLNNL